jgi:hypothetical protein
MMEGADSTPYLEAAETRMAVRSCNPTFRGAWRGAGLSGLSGSSRLSGFSGLFGSRNESNQINQNNKTNKNNQPVPSRSYHQL